MGALQCIQALGWPVADGARTKTLIKCNGARLRWMIRCTPARKHRVQAHPTKGTQPIGRPPTPWQEASRFPCTHDSQAGDASGLAKQGDNAARSARLCHSITGAGYCGPSDTRQVLLRMSSVVW